MASTGHDAYRDSQQMHDGSSPAGRERPSSMQGMDMASLPPRKRPWQDGPGTGDHRDMDPPCADGGERTGHCCTRWTVHKLLLSVDTAGELLTHTHRQGLCVCERCLGFLPSGCPGVPSGRFLCRFLVPGLGCRGSGTSAGVNSFDC